MMKRLFFISVFLSALLVFAYAGPVSAIEFFDGRVVIHGKISEQLAMRANKTSPGQLYDYDIFNFRTSLKLETMFRLQQCPDYEINLYGVFKEFYDYAHEVDSGYNNYLEDFSGHQGIQEVRLCGRAGVGTSGSRLTHGVRGEPGKRSERDRLPPRHSHPLLIVDTRTVGSTWGREHPDRCIARAKWSNGRHPGPVSPRSTNFSGVYRRQLASQAIEGYGLNEPSRLLRRQKTA